jgi:hypothetical protein
MLVRSKYPIVDSCEISYRTSEFGTMSQQTTTSELLNSEPDVHLHPQRVYIGRNASSQSTITFHSTHQAQYTPHEVVDVTRQNGGPHSLCLFVKHENHPKWRVNNIDRRIDGQMRTAELEGLDDDFGDICTTGHWLRMSKDAPMLVANGAKISLHRSSKAPLSCKEPSSTRRQRNARTRRMLGAYGKIATTLYFRMDLIDRDHPGRAWHSGAIDRSACTRSFSTQM